MEPIAIDDVTPDRFPEAADYRELLRRDSMSVGVYRIPAGETDPQDPHTEDEIYHVIEGHASIRIDGDLHPAETGDVVFVERGVEHRFVDVEDPLTVLVVFAPAEGSLGDE